MSNSDRREGGNELIERLDRNICMLAKRVAVLERLVYIGLGGVMVFGTYGSIMLNNLSKVLQ